MKTIRKSQYLWLKMLDKHRKSPLKFINISDEEYNELMELHKKIDIYDESEDHDYSQDYLTFEALEDGTFSFTVNDMYYSTNNGQSWKSLAKNTQTELITAGTKVLWKRDNILNRKGDTYGTDDIGTFSSTCKFNVSGNILSLYYINDFYNYDKFPTYSSTGYNTLTYVSQNMFKNCIYLINANNLILPNKLNERCYAYMFEGCTNLIIAPNLMASKLKYKCYYNMFNGCTSLNYIKMLATDISESSCLDDWVNNVATSGTFIKSKNITFNIGTSGIPTGWEVIEIE